jgi:hypothetical protein
MSSIGNIFDLLQIGVIASGGDPNGKGDKKGDFPSDKSSNQKVILPMTQDPEGVKQEHLAFSPMMHSPTAFSQGGFQGHLDPGALVYFLKMPGETGGIILGQANDLVNYDQGASGGQNLLGAQYFQDLFDRETGVNIPPEIKETEEDGVKVKAIKEKNKKHKHSLLKGLPSHNAMQPTTGYKLEEITNVPTAKQEFNALPTTDMMNMIPGNLMSLPQMFQGLMQGGGGAGGGGQGAGGQGAGQGTASGSAGLTASSTRVKVENPETSNTVIGSVAFMTEDDPMMDLLPTPMERLEQQLDPTIFNALSSISTLTQGMAASDVCSFQTASRVHYDTYMYNAETLLSQVTCLEDLFTAIHRLQHDTSLFGLENLAPVYYTVETAWGNANVVISHADIGLEYANANVQKQFAQSMTNPSNSPSAGGGGGGGNMFGKSAEKMMDMFKRLGPNNQKEAKQMHEKLNQGDDAQKLWKIVEKTLKGGNPLDPSLFK